jgi:hypothetical protein
MKLYFYELCKVDLCSVCQQLFNSEQCVEIVFFDYNFPMESYDTRLCLYCYEQHIALDSAACHTKELCYRCELPVTSREEHFMIRRFLNKQDDEVMALIHKDCFIKCSDFIVYVKRKGDL